MKVVEAMLGKETGDNLKTIYKIFQLSRAVKRSIQIIGDCTLIFLCFWLSMALRLDGIFSEIRPKSWLTLVAVIPLTILVFTRLGLYRAVVRYMTERAVTVIVIGSAMSALAMLLVSQYFVLQVPRSVPAIYFSFFVLATGGTRMLMRIVYLSSKDKSRSPVVIYGAGEAGRLLMRALQESRNYRPAIFIDDDRRLQGTTLGGTPIVSFEQAKEKIALDGIGTALIAVGESNPALKRQVISRMATLGVEVRTIPKIADLIAGRVRISALRRLTIDELLGRDVVVPDAQLMKRTTKDNSVLVTGAGGSIGSELCRQIFLQEPRRIVLLEASEYALYKILEDLTDLSKSMGSKVELIPILGSVTERALIERTITSNQVDTLYHAAAFKHVPLVEENAVEAFKNNTIGTHLTAQLAGSLGVKYFTLISTDKAVRPTNIMGATKRLAELAVQAAARTYPDTNFCSVRFGNVLGSSGSVVPKFERQIHAGGPITLTHPDVTRYFMTISEASQLVIQASAMAKNGEIYLLDMGEPIRILDLAKTMCALHGKKLIEANEKEAPENAIKLEITGLRAGEKLFEELLVTGEETATLHPRIRCEAFNDNDRLNLGTTIKMLSVLEDNAVLAQALASLPIQYERAEIIRHPSRCLE